MRTINKVVLTAMQHIPVYTNKQGNFVDSFDNEIEFTTETVQEITARSVAIWAICQLKKYLAIKRLQGKQGFKLSKDIVLNLTVNNKKEVIGTKFSLNSDRLQNVFERTPEMFYQVFAPTPGAYKGNTSAGLQFITAGKADITIAKNIKDLLTLPTVDQIIDIEGKTVEVKESNEIMAD